MRRMVFQRCRCGCHGGGYRCGMISNVLIGVFANNISTDRSRTYLQGHHL
jgi:hypothetical protein